MCVPGGPQQLVTSEGGSGASSCVRFFLLYVLTTHTGVLRGPGDGPFPSRRKHYSTGARKTIGRLKFLSYFDGKRLLNTISRDKRRRDMNHAKSQRRRKGLHGNTILMRLDDDDKTAASTARVHGRTA
jgi:hypothetical protein|uniref:Uncharacterized protein n=1 Tax=Sipha flava TaxID=143950 RepID=A0A2S2Q8Y4_9HEMI